MNIHCFNQSQFLKYLMYKLLCMSLYTCTYIIKNMIFFKYLYKPFHITGVSDMFASIWRDWCKLSLVFLESNVWLLLWQMQILWPSHRAGKSNWELDMIYIVYEEIIIINASWIFLSYARNLLSGLQNVLMNKVNNANIQGWKKLGLQLSIWKKTYRLWLLQ